MTPVHSFGSYSKAKSWIEDQDFIVLGYLGQIIPDPVPMGYPVKTEKRLPDSFGDVRENGDVFVYPIESAGDVYNRVISGFIDQLTVFVK